MKITITVEDVGENGRVQIELVPNPSEHTTPAAMVAMEVEALLAGIGMRNTIRTEEPELEPIPLGLPGGPYMRLVNGEETG